MSSEKPTGKLIARGLRLLYELNYMFLFCLAILPAALRQKADVYIGSGLHGLLPAYLASRLTGARLVYDSLELWLEQQIIPYSGWHRAMLFGLERTMCRRCDLIISVTESVGKILVERYGVSHPLVIPNVHPYQRIGSSAEIRARLSGGTDKRVVIFVGVINPSRGVEQLVEAAQYLNDDTAIAIVGDGASRPMLEERVKDRHLEDRVRFIGWVASDDILSYMASADLGISPMSPGASSCLNNYYSLDNKSFQYMMAGIPIAVSNQPEKRYLVERYGVGKVFNESDPSDIARVIHELLADSEEYEAMRARCLKAAREGLNWEVVSRRYIAAIEQLVVKDLGSEK